jgi:hypothetical protein
VARRVLFLRRDGRILIRIFLRRVRGGGEVLEWLDLSFESERNWIEEIERRLDGKTRQSGEMDGCMKLRFVVAPFVSLEAVSWRPVPGFDTGVEAWIIYTALLFLRFLFWLFGSRSALLWKR